MSRSAATTAIAILCSVAIDRSACAEAMQLGVDGKPRTYLLERPNTPWSESLDERHLSTEGVSKAPISRRADEWPISEMIWWATPAPASKCQRVVVGGGKKRLAVFCNAK